MGNLTKEKIVTQKEQNDTSVDGGYALVMKEDNQYLTFQEGELPKKRRGFSLIGKRKEQTLYAVRTDPRMSIEFPKVINHTDGVHHFTVEISVNYAVDQPAEVVKYLNIDPLKQLSEFTFKEIRSVLSTTSWDAIFNSRTDPNFSSRLMDTRVTSGQGNVLTLFEKISEQIVDYGLRPVEVNLVLDIPEDILEPLMLEKKTKLATQVDDLNTQLDIHKKKNDQEKALIDKQHDIEKLKLEGAKEVMSQLIKTSQIYIDKSGKTLSDSVTSIDDVAKHLIGALGLAGSLTSNSDPGTAKSPESFLGTYLTGTRSESLPNSTLKLLEEIKKVSLKPADQKILTYSLFLMIGFKIKGDSDAEIEKHSEDLKNIEVPKDLMEFFSAQWDKIKGQIERNEIL